MKSAIIYTRVSSREQQEGFSLGAQAKLLCEYAGRNGFEIVKAFEDVETAKTSGRTQFSEMMGEPLKDLQVPPEKLSPKSLRCCARTRASPPIE